ncbi:MAG: O-antigen ligase family protein, partial [Clostridium sp.]
SNGILLGKVSGMVEDTVNFGPDSGSFRIDIWMRVSEVIKSNPIIGRGPDTLIYTMFRYHNDSFSEHSGKYNQSIDKSHNEYLEYWVSCGIVTLITYLWLLIIVGRNLFKRREDDKYKVLLLTFIAYIVQAFFNISMPMVAPIWWIFLGYCVKCYREDDKKERDEIIVETHKGEALI